MKQIIDTHIHIWDLDKVDYPWLKDDTSILNQTYLIDQLTPQLPKSKVTQGILVQAANNFDDTDLMLEVALKTDWITGVVGWLPLMDPEATEKALVDKYAANKYFKGCRHLIHNETDTGWLLKDKVIKSLKILADYHIPFDVVGINTDHLKTAVKVAEILPGLRLVLDHLNQPPIASEERFGEWGEYMKVAAEHTNIYAKISGLGTAAGSEWTADDLKPYIMYVLQEFGTERCFCGGDWPVALLAGSYEKAWLAYQCIFAEELNEHDQEDILANNAHSFYNLSEKS